MGFEKVEFEFPEEEEISTEIEIEGSSATSPNGLNISAKVTTMNAALKRLRFVSVVSWNRWRNALSKKIATSKEP